jgi:Baseplate J-like protein
MPLQLPNLDDRTYDDLVQEAIALIPTYAPDWTNHNPSDPGITLIELFAYLSEILIYRLNRVTSANQYAFLKLLNGSTWQPTPEKSLAEETRETVLQLRQCDRAVTCADFENLALAVNSTLAPDQQQVARAHCIPKRNLLNDPTAANNTPGHVSIVIVPTIPSSQSSSDLRLLPSAALIQAVESYLEPRRLLTTKVHVVAPRYLTVRVQMTLMLKADALEAEVGSRANQALRDFFDPLHGGVEGQGWPFGRSIYVSELYQLLDRLPGVDYVTPTQATRLNSTDPPELPEILVVAADADQRQIFAEGRLSAVTLHPNELVNFQLQPPDLPPDISLKTPLFNLFTLNAAGA